MLAECKIDWKEIKSMNNYKLEIKLYVAGEKIILIKEVSGN